MATERTPVIRLGTFVALGICVLLAGMALIGRKRYLFSNTFTLHAMFHDVGGLQVGNKVRFAGVNIGTVKEMNFQDAKTIQVTLTIETKILKFLTTAAIGTVSSEGLIGNKILVLAEPGTGAPPLKDQDSIQAFPPPNLDELFNKVRGSVDNFSQITEDLGAITHTVRSGQGVVGKLFMDPAFSNTVDHTLVNLRKGSKGFEENMDAAKHSWVLWGSGKGKEKAKKEQENSKAKATSPEKPH